MQAIQVIEIAKLVQSWVLEQKWRCQVLLLDQNAVLQEDVDKVTIKDEPNWPDLDHQKYHNQSHWCSQINPTIFLLEIGIFAGTILEVSNFCATGWLVHLKHHTEEEIHVPDTADGSDYPGKRP